MKNKILDYIIKNDFSDQLERGEKIIWEGKPSLNWLSIIAQLFLTIILVIIHLIINPEKAQITAIVSFFGILLFLIYAYYQKSSTNYLITNKKVHFKFPTAKKGIFIAIPFEKIESVFVQKNAFDFNCGDITLYVDENEIKYDLEQISGHYFPTFESIYHVKEVEKYLNLGIERKL